MLVPGMRRPPVGRPNAPSTPGSRWIGPIPSVDLEDDDDDAAYYHPGGPAPAWGGYRPVPVHMTWGAFKAAAAAEVAAIVAWKAHTTETRLALTVEGWYVEAPDDRASYRCTRIAIGAIQDGRSDTEILALGISAAEIDSARTEVDREARMLAHAHEDTMVYSRSSRA